MIERGFIVQKTKEYYIKKYIEEKLSNVGVSHIRLKKIPLGEKIIIQTAKPSLIVGSKGSNIKELTRALKKEFQLENPQIEIEEVKNIFLDPKIVAERIASSLEKFGSARFKGVGHKMMENVIKSGALGVEIILSGKIPGARAKSWRFYNGYLKKCGDVSIEGVKRAQAAALLKSGIIGIKVAIMPPDVELPDRINIKEALDEKVEEIKVEKTEEKPKKKTTAKRPKKAKEANEEKKETATAVLEKKEAATTESKEDATIKEEVTEAVTELVAEEAHHDETS